MQRTVIILLIGLGILALLIVLWLVLTYNRLIRQRNRLREGWSGIDVQLKRRHNLVPNLVDCVKAYRDHERNLLEAVTRHRADAVAAHGATAARAPENALSHDLGRLLALAESYPELKADGQFRELAENLVTIEDDLQYARRYYNGCVRDQNNLVESFPGVLVAGAFGFGPKDYFEIENATERLTPDLGKQLKDG